MAQREDFEIYEFIRNGHQWYGFKVDYFGIYSAPSKQQILALRKKIQKKVAAKLAYIEKENQKYYARLAQEEEKRASLLHEAKEIENNIIRMLSCPTKALTPEEKKIRADIIYSMVDLGMSNEEIYNETQAPMQAIARVRYEYNKKITGVAEREM